MRFKSMIEEVDRQAAADDNPFAQQIIDVVLQFSKLTDLPEQ